MKQQTWTQGFRRSLQGNRKGHKILFCCSVAKLYLTLCDSMACSMLGSPVLHISRSLLKLGSIELVMPSNHLILCHPLLFLPSIFPCSRVFPNELVFASGGQSIEASASVFPMNIQGWLCLGLTGLNSLLSKGLSRVFCSTTIQKHQFFGLSHLYGTTLTSVHDHWKNHSFDYMDKVMSLLFNTVSRFVIAFLPTTSPDKLTFTQVTAKHATLF